MRLSTMRIFVFIQFVIILIGLSACAQGNSSTPSLAPPSGIEGFVTIGPVCPGPVQEGDTSCLDKPYQASITILDAANIRIMQFQTDPDGYFKVPLAPGTYTIHPEPGEPLPIAADQTVVVSEGVFTQVLIQYDSGMR